MKHSHLLITLLLLTFAIVSCIGKPLPYTYTADDATAAVDPISRTIAFGEETFPYTHTSDGGRFNPCYHIHFPDGSEYHWTYTGTGSGITGWSENFDSDRWSYAEFLMEALRQPKPREKTGQVIAGLLLMGFGAAIYFLPVLGFYFCYDVVVEKAKLSHVQIRRAKIGGVIAAVLGLVWCVI